MPESVNKKKECNDFLKIVEFSNGEICLKKKAGALTRMEADETLGCFYCP